MVANFNNALIIMEHHSDVAVAQKLMNNYLILDLEHAIDSTSLGIFIEVGDNYTKMFQPAALVVQTTGGGQLKRKESMTLLVAAVAAKTAKAATGSPKTAKTIEPRNKNINIILTSY